MTSMVERMARAMITEVFATSAPLLSAQERGEFSQRHLGIYEEMALAALRELREPTEVMAGATAAASAMGQHPHQYITAAIDAEIAAYEAGRADPLLRTP